jgi:hypothetical protein
MLENITSTDEDRIYSVSDYFDKFLGASKSLNSLVIDDD